MSEWCVVVVKREGDTQRPLDWWVKRLFGRVDKPGKRGVKREWKDKFACWRGAGGATVSTVIPNLGCKTNMTADSEFDSRTTPGISSE